MSVHKLLDPILEQGVLHTNFFEGRLLTAQDLRDQQDATRARERRIGRAVGHGIVDGLEVQIDSDGADGKVPVVRVKQGLAINPDGEIIGLPQQDVLVALARSVTADPTTDADFYACAGEPASCCLPNGAGVYLLVMSPAAGHRDSAPKCGLADAGVIKGCGSRYVQEGVRFRLVDLRPSTLDVVSAGTRYLLQTDLLSQAHPVAKGETARTSLLRNVLAHICFGTEGLERFGANPFLRADDASAYTHCGAVDALREAGDLSGCDVPLALLYWTFDGLVFCDLWSVRRPVTPPPRSSEWPVATGARAVVEGEARLLQFFDQMADLALDPVALGTLRARDYFRYLPAAGVLPVGGVSVNTFFQDLTVRWPRAPRFDQKAGPVFMDGARLAPLLRVSVAYPPIDVLAEEAVWIYRIRENARAVGTQKAVAFASGQIPYVGSDRFDVAAWDYSNYVSALVGPGGF